ncbi:hypothetical protein MVES1_003281 [Malassezia vespertilionis]|nr:uncharacterized protein MVES1_003281 [Malassezia vespertilionis]WFD07912.1 hypothetical protein MVES1_003281 [Malassezia vespertilionis]
MMASSHAQALSPADGMHAPFGSTISTTAQAALYHGSNSFPPPQEMPGHGDTLQHGSNSHLGPGAPQEARWAMLPHGDLAPEINHASLPGKDNDAALMSVLSASAPAPSFTVMRSETPIPVQNMLLPADLALPQPNTHMAIAGDRASLQVTPIPYDLQDAPGQAPASSQDARRMDNAQLRNFLKLDVDMGFVADERNASPNLLQPVFGWKKRRSVSDVGPRTPSWLGLAADNAVSPMDELPFEAPTRDSALNFEALQIRVDEQKRPDISITTPADAAQTLHSLSTSTCTAHTDYVPIPGMPAQHSASPPFVQTQSTYEPHTGPVRSRAGTRSPRSSSPYATPMRSVTPDAPELHFQVNEQDVATARMSQWRFPCANPLQDTLHPMDAITRRQDLLSVPDMEMRSLGRVGRRHLRTAMSEDLQASTRSTMHGMGHSMDWQKPPVSSVSMMQINPGFAPEMHNRSLSPEMVRWATQNMSGIALQEQQLLAMNQEALNSGRTTPIRSPTPGDLSPSPSSTIPSPSPSSDMTPLRAAQTRTPVVTTSAAQAASASRRKAEAVFTCPFPDCGSTFTRQYNLRGHMRSHMDQRPFKCTWPGCGRSFARTHDCKRHHNLHLNIKPYTCEGCGKTFARLDALNRHNKSEGGACACTETDE